MSAAPSTGDAHELLASGLSQRLRGTYDAHDVHDPSDGDADDQGVTLGPATQVEIAGDEVRFFVPFSSQVPGEHWLRAFRDPRLGWPSGLFPPRLEDGRGVRLGPLPVNELAPHVEALKAHVAAANRFYYEEIEPELRRQREEAERREDQERRVRAEVDAQLKRLLG